MLIGVCFPESVFLFIQLNYDGGNMRTDYSTDYSLARGIYVGLLVLTLNMGLCAVTFAQVQRIFISDSTDKMVYRYNESAAATSSWSTGAATNPRDIYVTDTNVYILDGASFQVYRYTYDGGSATASKVLKDFSGASLGTIESLTIAGDELWVGEMSATNKRVLMYSLTNAFSASGTLNATRQFNFTANNTDCQGLAIDATYLYVLDQTDRVFYRYPRTTANNATGVAAVSGTMRNASGSNLTALTGAVAEGAVMRVVNASGTNTLNRFDLTALFATTGNVNATSTYNTTSANGNSTGYGLNALASVVSIRRNEQDPTNTSTVDFNVVFSEAVTGVGAGDFTLTNTGSLSGSSIASVSADSGNSRTVTVNTGSGSGTIRLNFNDDDSVIDIGRVPIGGTGTDVDHTGDEVYTIDKTAPTATVSGPASPTKSNPLISRSRLVKR